MEFTVFFIILLAALVFPLLLKGFHIPWVVTLILAGLILGPTFLDVIGDEPALNFLGEIGLIFLMFLAGVETGLSRLKSTRRESAIIGFINGIIPFIAGFSLSLYLGFEIVASLIVGIVMMSSSAVVSLPSLEKHELLNKKVGTTVLASTVIQDLFSLLLIGVLMHYINPVNSLPLPLFILFLFGSVFLFKYSIPLIKSILDYEERSENKFETELRTVIVILIGAVVLYELIGLDSIVAGFITGLFLSDTLTDEVLKSKIHAIGYGLLIPVFFIQVGSQINLFDIFGSGGLLTAVLIVVTSIISKYSSGYLTAKNLGFDSHESSIIASTSIPQLSTTLAVIYLGLQNKLITVELSAALIGLVIFTSIIGPSMINLTLQHKRKTA